MRSKFSKLSEVADVIDSLHKTPKYADVGRPMVRCTDVKYGRLDLSKTFKVNDEVFAEFSRRYTPKREDIIITRVGSYGITAIVEDKNFCLGQNTSVVVPKINPRYLYLALNSPYIKNQIEFSVVGSTQKTLSLKAINNLDIPRFDPDVEGKIAEIIGDLDDKIELNRQTNQTLEQIAQAIFKSWFVDFEPVKAKIQAKEEWARSMTAKDGGNDENAGAIFVERAAMCAISGKSLEELEQLSPETQQQLKTTAALFPNALVESELGEIPEGWVWSEIGSEVKVVGGGTPSTKNDAFWAGGNIHWTSPKDMSNLTDKILLNTSRKITEAGLAKISSGLLPENTVLMSSRAPVGYLAIVKVPVAINQGYIAMKCEAELTPEYVVQWAESVMDEIKQRASGTTFAEISKKNFKVISVIVPNVEVVSEYTEFVSNIYSNITESIRETKYLADTRDALLPKLLSGEVSIGENQPVAEAVA